jgi:hypothetical protein
MPPFSAESVSDAKLAKVYAYLKSIPAGGRKWKCR